MSLLCLGCASPCLCLPRTQTRTRNIELSRDEKAEARKIVSAKKGRLESAREKVEVERRRKQEVDAVWDED